jgi:multicomponent Na+:H+ antiporter subunit B
LKYLSYLVIGVTLGLLLYTTVDMPDWGDPNSPASVHVSPRYIENSLEETAIPNMVTAVLADYRGYDTLFELVVIFTAGISVVLMLRRARK